MDEQRKIPVHRALNRPNLLMGGERSLVLMSLLTAAIVCFTASSWIMLGIGILLWFFLQMALIQMAKADPQMSMIYLRHVRYKPYYPARSGEYAAPTFVAEWKD